jgi:hypothetical protein
MAPTLPTQSAIQDRQQISLQRSTCRAELGELQLIQSVPGEPNGGKVSPDQITIAAVKNAEPVLVQEMKNLSWQEVTSLEHLRPNLEIDPYAKRK